MSRSLLRMELIGNIGKEPEYMAMPNGTAVAKLSVACARDYKNKASGESVSKTVWVPLKAYGRNAEILQQYCRSGSKLYIECEYSPYEYEKDGQKKYGHEFILQSFQMLDSKPQSQTSQPAQQHRPTTQAPAQDDFEDSQVPF